MVKTSVNVWLGCTSRRFVKEPVKALKYIFRRIDLNIKIIDIDELCCGSVLYTTGQGKRGNENRAAVEKMLREKKISEMILLCPGCLRTFSEYYVPRRNNSLKQVYHYTQILSKNLDSLDFKTSRRRKIKVTYHDPCHLGRHMGITEPPRLILKAIPNVEFLEMPKAKDESFCCGSGGGVRAYNKTLADHSSVLRLREAQYSGADYLVTSCPFCERSFLSAQESDRSIRGIKVQNLAVFLNNFLTE